MRSDIHGQFGCFAGQQRYSTFAIAQLHAAVRSGSEADGGKFVPWNQVLAAELAAHWPLTTIQAPNKEKSARVQTARNLPPRRRDQPSDTLFSRACRCVLKSFGLAASSTHEFTSAPATNAGKLQVAQAWIRELFGTGVVPRVPDRDRWDEESVPEKRGKPASAPATNPLSGTYRTVCVRLCDGFYFPISFSTYRSHFKKDAQPHARIDELMPQAHAKTPAEAVNV
jgi:hypothetical protein